MKFFAAAFVILALGLAGCAQSPTITVSSNKKITKVAPKLVEAPLPKKKSPPPVAVIKPQVLLEPIVVVGKTDAEIQNVFGDPNLRRKESPAEVWQYLAANCALHLFFYPGEAADTLVVRHIAINGRSVETFSDLDRKKCFNDHLNAVGAEEAFITKKTS